MASSSLKSFIKDVRGAKTLADERTVVTKQAAKVRTRLRNDRLPHSKRRVNISKLLYLYILGEDTRFAQVECINLIASDDFVDKRLGYLAAILLLDESPELLTLLTNMLNNDINHPNKYVVSLAMTTLGALSSTELARDLFPDVERILTSNSEPFLLKKALQCQAKLLEKDHSLLEIVTLDPIAKLLASPGICTHGVLLGINKVVQTILLNSIIHQQAKSNATSNRDSTDMTGDHYDHSRSIVVNLEQEHIDALIDALYPFLKTFMDHLKSINSRSLDPTFDVDGISDPFLQCELIYTLRLYFQYGAVAQYEPILKSVERFGDVLTQVATNTSTSKSSGQAVLYETSRTIFSLDLSQALYVLGVNIVAKFLSGKDNNTKYVALNTLLSVVSKVPTAIQRHRQYISKCLHDPDISIRLRALELTFRILDESNISDLVDDLLVFLERTDVDDKDLIVYTVDSLVDVFEKYKNCDENWKLATFIKVLRLVGSYISFEKLNDILLIINNIRDVRYRCESTIKILRITLNNHKSQNVLNSNLGWHLASIWCIGEYADVILKSVTAADEKLINSMTMTEYLVAKNSEYSGNNMRMVNYLMTAALKLSTKLDEPKCIERLRQLILSHSQDKNLILQTKSIQYELIFNQPLAVKAKILDTMPRFEKKSSDFSVGSNNKLNTKTNSKDLLLDLIGDETTSLENEGRHSDQKVQSSVLNSDLLKSVLSGGAMKQDNKVQLPDNLSKVHENEDFRIYATEPVVDANGARLELYFESLCDIKGFKTLCAVPKVQKLSLGQLKPSSSVSKGEVMSQTVNVHGTGSLKIRVKYSYNTASSVDKVGQFDYKTNINL